MLRVLLLIILLTTSSNAYSKGNTGKPVDIFYLPHIHAKFGGKDYKSRGGDMVFFSYLHIALEILKDPGKYEVYNEGFYFSLNRRARYRIRRSEFRKFRKIFPTGFPKNVTSWNAKQKAAFIEYGPITTLYLLKRINIIRKTERWTNEKKIARHLEKCSQTPFFKNLGEVFASNIFSSWKEFYPKIRNTQTGKSRKICHQIFAKREVYLVKKIRKRRKTAKKPLLIIFGYAHDFGQYFNGEIKYIGTPELTYAAMCYHYRNTPPDKNFATFCYYNYKKWLTRLGHQHYFNEHQNFGYRSFWSDFLGLIGNTGKNTVPGSKTISPE
ncbi:MAG: hypothetical protein ACRBBN_05830 [Methyloligellaceae bacterium]